MKFLLDTNVCIHLMNRTAPRLAERVASEQPSDLGISSVTEAELLFGIAKSVRRKTNRKRFDEVLSELRVRPFDSSAAAAYALVRADLERKGKPIGPLDTLIAGHALALDAVLITNNLVEFRRVKGLRVEDWL